MTSNTASSPSRTRRPAPAPRWRFRSVPSGGLLSKDHPLGATGVANIVEIVWHLRGEAGARQVENSKVGLAHVIGLGSACTINIIKK